MRHWAAFLIVFGAYLLGSINLAYLAGRRLKGIDLRKVGSGNLGTGNVYHQVGKGVGALVFFLDCAKEALAILLPRALGLGLGVQAAAGAAVIAGHNWPLFLRFRGGRGMAMTLTGTLILLPWEGVIMVSLMAVGVTTHHLPELNLLALALSPVVAWRLGRPLELVLYAVGLLVMGILRRLQGSPGLQGGWTAGRRWELFWCRLLLDREGWNKNDG